MTTATATLRVLIVWPKDTYDTQTCAAYPRCRARLADLDVVVIDPGNAVAARHIQCISASQRALLPPPADAESRCWYGAETPNACPFPIEAHNLCADHHGQLCRDGKKKPSRARQAAATKVL